MDCRREAATARWRPFKGRLCALLRGVCAAHCPIVSSVVGEGGLAPEPAHSSSSEKCLCLIDYSESEERPDSGLWF